MGYVIMTQIKKFKAFHLILLAFALIFLSLFLAIISNAEEYSVDVGIVNIYTTPTVGEEDELREISVKIRNFGEANITQDITDVNPINISCTVLNRTSLEPEYLINDEVQLNEILSKEIEYLIWEWRPKFKGDYIINISIDFALDENPINDIKSIISYVNYEYLSEDFEEDTFWETGRDNSEGSYINHAIIEWEHGTPLEELKNGGKGPFGANSGNKCYGADLDDRYGKLHGEIWEGYQNDSTILYTEVNLMTSRYSILSFFHWLEIEDSGNDDEISDKAFVEISSDEGESWNEIWRNPVALDPENVTVYRTNGWEQVILNVDKYDGKSYILIRWKLQTNHNISYAGWYIDDVCVVGKAPLERDAGIDSIDSPLPGVYLPLGQEVEIKATIKNYGLADLVNCKVILNVVKSLGGEPWVYEKYIGTVQNPIPTGGTTQVIFDWSVSYQFNDVEYDITVSTHLTNVLDKYIDKYSFNDVKSIRVTVKNVFEVAVESINVFPRLSERGKPRTVTANIVTYGNQEQRLNIILEAKWRQRDKGGNSPDWDDVEPMEPNPFHGIIPLEPWEKLTNWNTTFIPEIYGEYLLTLKVNSGLYYDFKTGLWVPIPNEPHDCQGNNFKSITLLVPNILWQDDMEWGPDEEKGEWIHKPENSSIYDDWHIEEGGYFGSEFSWRCGQGKIADKYSERLYNNNMDAVLESPQIPLKSESVKDSFGISFWMKYSIEPMDFTGEYLDSLFLEFLPIGGNPFNNDDWQGIYENDYNHSPYNLSKWDARLFWPKDNGLRTNDSEEYPENIDGWIYNQIIFDEKDPETGEYIYVNEIGELIDNWLWDGFQFRFRFETDSKLNFTGPWIDNVSVFGLVEKKEQPIAKFQASWNDIGKKSYYAFSWNIIKKLPIILYEQDNVMPNYGYIPYNDDDFNNILFDARWSADPWDGPQGLTYNWDFNHREDSDKDGNYTNDKDKIGTYQNASTITWKFTNYGTYIVTLTVENKDGLVDIDTIKVNCEIPPKSDIEIIVEDIFETKDSKYPIDDIEKYNSGEYWNIWQGDKIVFSDNDGFFIKYDIYQEFIFNWSYYKVTDIEFDFDKLEWITLQKGEYDFNITFNNPGKYRVFLEIDDSYNHDRYKAGYKPKNCSWSEIAKYPWLDYINITVLPFAKQTKTIFISDLDNDVVEVRYEIDYQELNLNTEDSIGKLYVNKTDEPEDSESNRHLRTFVELETKNMYDEYGKEGFIWLRIIIIYDKSNPMAIEMPNQKYEKLHLLYFWEKSNNRWIKCQNTKKATDNDIRDLTAVEANVTYLSLSNPAKGIIAPMINVEAYPDFGNDPAIDTLDISFSVDTILGRGGKERDVNIYAKIHNKGLLSIMELDVKFKDGDEIIKEIVVYDIPGKGSKIVSIIWRIDRLIDIGLHTIKVELDPADKIYDLDNSNNIARKKINVVEAGMSYYSNKDTDHDGIINIFDDDDDNDGFTDIEELDAGTDHLNPNSNPKQKKVVLILLFCIIVICIIFIVRLHKKFKKEMEKGHTPEYPHRFKYAIQPYRKLVSILFIIIFVALLIAGYFLCESYGNSHYRYDTPNGTIQTVGSGKNSYTVKVVEMNPTIYVSGIPWKLKDSNGNTVGQNFGTVDDIYGLITGNVTFHDNDRDGKISPEDTFTVVKELPDGTKIPKGYSLSLTYPPTHEELCTAIL